MDFGLLGGHLHEGHDDEFVAHLSFPCRSAIQANDAGTSFAFDDVGFEALSIVVVDDKHFLVGDHACGIDQIFIDGDAAGVVQFRLG